MKAKYADGHRPLLPDGLSFPVSLSSFQGAGAVESQSVPRPPAWALRERPVGVPGRAAELGFAASEGPTFTPLFFPFPLFSIISPVAPAFFVLPVGSLAALAAIGWGRAGSADGEPASCWGDPPTGVPGPCCRADKKSSSRKTAQVSLFQASFESLLSPGSHPPKAS